MYSDIENIKNNYPIIAVRILSMPRCCWWTQSSADAVGCPLAGHADVDEPPRSDAGQDVVIQLPTDWAVLDGRDSVDDHDISHYEWTLIKGDTAIGMKVSVRPHPAHQSCRVLSL